MNINILLFSNNKLFIFKKIRCPYAGAPADNHNDNNNDDNNNNDDDDDNDDNDNNHNYDNNKHNSKALAQYDI